MCIIQVEPREYPFIQFKGKTVDQAPDGSANEKKSVHYEVKDNNVETSS